MIAFVQSVVSFAVLISLLIFVHELGHYLAARWRGVEVQVFSIGFGRRVFGRRDRHGTMWQLSAIPLGGYVRMLGQSDFGADETAPSARFGAVVPSRSFAEKSILSRAIVVAAGPVFNFVFAILVFAFVYSVAGRPTDRPVVVGVIAGSAAAAAGVQPGDEITAVDGHRAAHVVDVPALVAPHAGEPIAVALSRASHKLTVTVTPRAAVVGGHRIGQLGIEIGAAVGGATRLSVPAAFAQGARDCWAIAAQIVVLLWTIVSGGGGASNLHSVLVIAKVSGQAAAAGWVAFATLVAMLSVNLGLVNLLPIPILDGGHLMFYAIEALLRRPLSRRAQMLGFQAGFALIAMVMVLITVNDLADLGLFRWARALAG